MDNHLTGASVILMAGAPLFPIYSALFSAILLALLYALISAVEAAFPLMKSEPVRRLDGLSARKRDALLRFSDNPASFRTFIRCLRLFSVIFLGWVFISALLGLCRQCCALPDFLDFPLVALFGFLAIFLLLSFASALPARLASRNPERFAARVIGLTLALESLFRPLCRLSSRVSDALLIKSGINPLEDEAGMTEVELREMLDKSKEEGHIPDDEQILIENVFEFGDKSADLCMTHRTDLVAVELNTEMPELLAVLSKEKFTRMPVYREDLDHIIGIFNTRDLLLMIAEGREDEFSLEQVMREPFYAPESAKIATLFRDLQRTRNHLAVLIDEYGGTAGIVTMEDLLEEIVGQIQDEYDEEEPEIERLSDDCWLVDGSLALTELSDLLDLDLPSDDYDTVAGFFLDLLDRIPGEEEKAETRYADLRLVVEKMEEKRIAKIMICRDDARLPEAGDGLPHGENN